MILNTLNSKKGRFICLFFVLFFVGCATPSKKVVQYKLTGDALGTTYHITYLGDEITGLLVAIDSILVEFNYGLSTYDPNSFISAYNNNLSLNLYEFKPGYAYLERMMSKSQPIIDATNGAFDPSAAALFALYDDAKKQNRLIDSAAIKLALDSKGFEAITIGNDSLMQNIQGKQLNFNAIAKGYFVDILSEFLTSKGCLNHMVEVGGEVRCMGSNSQDSAWNIGINRPEIGTSVSDYFEVISLSNQSMATSGNYQNFYVVDGQIIGHTFDPRTGKAVISDLKSATVVHKECAIADAYATACMVLGLEASRKLIESDTSLSAYFIYEVGGTLVGVHVK